jgi:hypothetical protein
MTRMKKAKANEEGKDRGEGIVDDQKFEDKSVGERQLNSNSTENEKKNKKNETNGLII